MIPSDLDLIGDALRGKREAFATLMLRHQQSVAKYLVVRGCKSGDLDDLCQETFAIALAKLSHYVARDRFSAWLCGIARIALRLHGRKSKKDRDLLEKAPDWLPTRPVEPEPPDAGEIRERSEALREAILSLSAEHRVVLLLKYEQHLRIAEIARVEKISTMAAKMRLTRARHELRVRLAAWNPYPSGEVEP
jgi:RNA polymerase sigma-70 factor (ECF subfamily)